MDSILKKYSLTRKFSFYIAFLLTSGNTFECYVFIFHTNCLPFGFSSPLLFLAKRKPVFFEAVGYQMNREPVAM